MGMNDKHNQKDRISGRSPEIGRSQLGAASRQNDGTCDVNGRGYEWSDADGDFNVLAGLLMLAQAAHPPAEDVCWCRRNVRG